MLVRLFHSAFHSNAYLSDLNSKEDSILSFECTQIQYIFLFRKLPTSPFKVYVLLPAEWNFTFRWQATVASVVKGNERVTFKSYRKFKFTSKCPHLSIQRSKDFTGASIVMEQWKNDFNSSTSTRTNRIKIPLTQCINCCFLDSFFHL